VARATAGEAAACRRSSSSCVSVRRRSASATCPSRNSDAGRSRKPGAAPGRKRTPTSVEPGGWTTATELTSGPATNSLRPSQIRSMQASGRTTLSRGGPSAGTELVHVQATRSASEAAGAHSAYDTSERLDALGELDDRFLGIAEQHHGLRVV